MKLITLFLLVFSSLVFATPTPFSPGAYKEIVDIKNHSERVIRVDFDARSTTRATGYIAYSNNTVPADAHITDVKGYFDRALVSASGNTVSVGCTSAVDLFAAASMEVAVLPTFATNFQVQGIPNNGATTNQVLATSACTPYVTVGAGGAGGSGFTNGRIIWRIKYISVED